MQSESIGKLAEALSKAQAEMSGAKKDASNPFFKSKYADLEAVWEACRKPLTDNGLAVVQTLQQSDKCVVIKTTLMHSSGEWIDSELSLMPAKADAQGIGSAISYGRRYSLAAMVGIYQTDDDGEVAVGRTGGAKQAQNPPPVTAPVASQSPSSRDVFTKHLTKSGWTKAQLSELSKIRYNNANPYKLSLKDQTDLIDYVSKHVYTDFNKTPQMDSAPQFDSNEEIPF